MINQDYHKGSFCVYSSVFCQEGYCFGCEIYGKRPAVVKTLDHCESVSSQKRRQPVLVN
jgi:hypothetical protein